MFRKIERAVVVFRKFYCCKGIIERMTWAICSLKKCVYDTHVAKKFADKKTKFGMCVQNVSTYMHFCRYRHNVLIFEISDSVMAVREKLVRAISKYLKCVCETPFKVHVEVQYLKFGIWDMIVRPKTGWFDDIAAFTGLSESSFQGKVCHKINISSPWAFWKRMKSRG